MDTPDVTSTAPSAAGDEQPEGTTQPTAQVTGTQDDRPLQNTLAEYNRKFSGLKQQLDTVMQYLVTTKQPQYTPPPAPPKAELTDEDLWGLAQQGDRQAFEMYQTRIADRRVQAAMGTQQRSNIIAAQLQAIMGRYPVLNDASHPLTQTVQQAYRLLVGQGYAADQTTLLEAAKTAIADRPDLVSDLYTKSAQTQDSVRRSSTSRAQSGVTGASHRMDTPSRGQSKPLSPEEHSLAKRMLVKDPAGSKARFLKRRAEGRSNLGAVQAFLSDEDLQDA